MTKKKQFLTSADLLERRKALGIYAVDLALVIGMDGSRTCLDRIQEC